MAFNVFHNLNAFGIETHLLTNDEEIVKTRYIDEKSNQQILRVDEELEVIPLDDEVFDGEYDALVISDYDKGFITQTKLFELCNNFAGPIFIDTKKIAIPGNAFIKVNEYEFKKITHYDPDNMIITKGGEGTEYQGKLYPAEKVKVFDVVGAGDTFLAALTYGYLNYGSIEEAIPLANKAAAIAVSHTGTYVLKEEDVKTLLC
jgi:D-beta-D-heptose 7-phosphate kinase/D-beta-D-heptose 1-phosphate adenosyltransferase